MYQNIACVIFSALIKPLAQLFGKKAIHTFGLLCLGVPLVAMTQLHDPTLVLIAMAITGIGWATTLSLPFALLADHIPAGNEGVLTGTFNIFIAAPQFIASPLVGLLVSTTQWHASALLLGGTTVIISALLLQWVQESKTPQPQLA
jgi:maltose/moltooligosaccharide transporter